MKHHNYKFAITLLFLLICPYLNCHAGYGAHPKRETRAVWLTTYNGLDWPKTKARSPQSVARQKQELCEILDKLKQANINTVLLQTRIRATTIYPSMFEPWDKCFSGNDGKAPGYDPLQFAIDECHKRGMELHAWVVTLPAGKWNNHGCKILRKKNSRLLNKINNEGYLNPENNQTAAYLAAICNEIVKNYDVDGIHLDYIRYPETMPIRYSRSKARNYITNIVRAIHDSVKKEKEWVKISCSPIGKYSDLARYSSRGWNAFDRGCQDAQLWLKEGLMDMLFPMIYFRDNNFFPFAINWAEESNGKTIAGGLGIYFLHPQEKDWSLETVSREMYVLRQYDMGAAMFRSKFFTDNVKDLYSFATDEFYKYPALIPETHWIANEKPAAPANLNIERYENGDFLKWEHAGSRSDRNNIAYNIYASRSYPVNTDCPQNLIATYYRHDSIWISHPMEQHYNYSIKTIDRCHIESSNALNSIPLKENETANQTGIANDGKHIDVDIDTTIEDVDYLLFEDICGQIVDMVPFKQGKTDISLLKDGYYTVRTLSHKGNSHRIGNLIIKRR